MLDHKVINITDKLFQVKYAVAMNKKKSNLMTKRTFGLFSMISAISIGGFTAYAVLANPQTSTAAQNEETNTNTRQVDNLRVVARSGTNDDTDETTTSATQSQPSPSSEVSLSSPSSSNQPSTGNSSTDQRVSATTEEPTPRSSTPQPSTTPQQPNQSSNETPQTSQRTPIVDDIRDLVSRIL